jgi:two-component sensor histidine kinase
LLIEVTHKHFRPVAASSKYKSMTRRIFFITLHLFLWLPVCYAQTAFQNEAAVKAATQQALRMPLNAERARLLLQIGRWHALQGADTLSAKEAEKYVEQSIDINNQLKDKPAVASGYLTLSLLAQIAHDCTKGNQCATKAATLFESLGNMDQAGEAYVMVWSNFSLSGLPVPQRIPLLQKAANAFHAANNKSREADCYKEQADLYQIMAQFPQALNDLKYALALYQQAGYQRLQAVYDLLGSVYMALGDYNTGIQYGYLAIKTAERVGDTSLSLCTYYNRLGMAYIRLNDMNNAQKYFHKALDIATKYNDLDGMYNLSFNIAFRLLWSGKPKEGLDFLNNLLRKHPEEAKLRAPEIACFMIPAYQRLGQYDKALSYCPVLEDAIRKEPDNIQLLSKGADKLVTFYIKIGNLQKAAQYVKVYHDFSDKRGLEEFKVNYCILQFRLDSAMGNYLSAIGYYQNYARLKDSLFNETKSLQINHFQVLYETEKKDKDILILKKEAELQQSHLRQVTLIRNITFSGILLSVIVMLLLYQGFRNKQRTNKKLRSQQAEIKHKNDILQNLVIEKEWLVKEIHHRVKNNLHTVVGLLASQTEFLKSEEALAAIADSQHRVHAMSLIHQKLYQTEDLSSTNMASYIFDLTEYLKDSFEKAASITFKLDITDIEFSLAYSVPVGLIINEAVTNAIKYAFPNRNGTITIRLNKVNATQFLLNIQDDGIGLPKGFDREKCSSLGLMLMQGLSADIGGTFDIVSNQGTGIEILFSSEAARDAMNGL